MTFAFEPFVEAGAEELGGEEAAEALRGTKSYPVASTCFARIEYDRDTQTLTMTFQKGGSYQIEGIEEIEVERWMAAESVGAYFNENIRGRY